MSPPPSWHKFQVAQQLAGNSILRKLLYFRVTFILKLGADPWGVLHRCRTQTWNLEKFWFRKLCQPYFAPVTVSTYILVLTFRCPTAASLTTTILRSESHLSKTIDNPAWLCKGKKRSLETQRIIKITCFGQARVEKNFHNHLMDSCRTPGIIHKQAFP